MYFGCARTTCCVVHQDDKMSIIFFECCGFVEESLLNLFLFAWLGGLESWWKSVATCFLLTRYDWGHFMRHILSDSAASMCFVVSVLKRLYMHTFPGTKSTPPNVLEIHMQTASTLTSFFSM